MRIAFYLSMLVFGLLVSSCKEDADTTRLQMTPLRYTIPAGNNPLRAHFWQSGQISTEQMRFTEETNIPWEDWTRIAPARASLIITEPLLDWSFVAEVSISAFTDDPNRLTELFYRDQIPLDVGPRLDLIPTDFDAYDLLDHQRINLVIELRRLRRMNSQSMPVTLEWSFAGSVE